MTPALLRSRAVTSRVDAAAAVGIRTVISTWSQARLLRLLCSSGTEHQFLDGWKAFFFLSAAFTAAAPEIESV